jgi:hypothetical protein
VLAFAGVSNAAIQIVNLGTGAPPATVGGFAMTPAVDDTRGLFLDVFDVVVDPNCGPVNFVTAGGPPNAPQPMNHRQIGSGWATWSHGYAGDVYYTNGLTDVQMLMPAGTAAFYFYAEPNPFSTFLMTVESGSESLTVPVDGFAGANGFGIYEDAGGSIVSVTISSNVDFAVGEFGINCTGGRTVPEPASMALWSMLGLCAAGARWLRRKSA